jgi:hypothetical protein
MSKNLNRIFKRKSFGMNQTSIRALEQVSQFFNQYGHGFSKPTIMVFAILCLRNDLIRHLKRALAAKLATGKDHIAEVVDSIIESAERARLAK